MALDPLNPRSARLLTPQGDIALGGARGIWIRRPRWPVIDDSVKDEADRALARQEAVAAMGGALRVLADRCVSPADAIQAARWKVAQLFLAADLGFAVPETLVTNSVDQLKRFRKRGRTVIKAVADARVRAGDTERYGFTEELREEDDLDGVSVAPVLVQRLIAKVADWRVTMIGHRPYSVRMTTPGDAPLDIRRVNNDEVRFEVRDLPTQVEHRLKLFMARFGLRFAAFDLAEDAAGSVWFLECNPSGQWGWLEDRTGLRMTDALLNVLVSPAS